MEEGVDHGIQSVVGVHFVNLVLLSLESLSDHLSELVDQGVDLDRLHVGEGLRGAVDSLLVELVDLLVGGFEKVVHVVHVEDEGSHHCNSREEAPSQGLV